MDASFWELTDANAFTDRFLAHLQAQSAVDGTAGERFDEIGKLFVHPQNGFDVIREATRAFALRRRAELA